MNPISLNTPTNPNIAVNTQEQVQTTQTEQGQAVEKSALPRADNLGQNQVSRSDISGVTQQISLSALESGVPILSAPNETAAKDISAGTGSKLFGEMGGVAVILNLMLETIQSAYESRAAQREFSTIQQNISINEGMAQVNKMMQAADKTRTGAIVQGAIGGLGTTTALGGLAGMNKGISKSLGGKGGIDTAKQAKLESKLSQNNMKQLGVMRNSLASSTKGSSKLSSQDKAKLDKLKNKAEDLKSKLEVVKNPTSEKAKALQQAKADNIKAAMEAFSGSTNTFNSTFKAGMDADAATLNAKGQLDNIRSDTAKTERSKSESQYDNIKSTISALNRLVGDILQALNSASSSAARA